MPEIALGRHRFRPGLFATLLTVAFVALTIALGQWQTGRAAQKIALQQRLEALAAQPPEALPGRIVDAAEWAQHRVAGHGRYQGPPFLLDNRLYRGAPGYQVIQAFCPEDAAEPASACVLVNRGWVALGARRDAPPRVETPQGAIGVEGMAVLPPPHPYELGSEQQQGAVIEHLVIERLAQRTGLKLQAFVLQQTSAAPDGLVRDWPRPDTGVDMHRAYALQWYAMAVVAVALWIGLNTRRRAATDDAVTKKDPANEHGDEAHGG